MKKYRLKDEKYRKPAQLIADFAEGGSEPLEYYISKENSSMRNRLIEYGVFELWFEEVKPEYKSGDYIYVPHLKEIYQIEDCEVIGDELHWNTVGVDRLRYKYRFSTLLDYIRHATAEEIEEYKKQLPIIGGHRGELKGDFIVYGCQKIHVQDFNKMYEALEELDVNSITIAGHEVPMETLREIYEKIH